MAKLDILIAPDPMLKTSAEPVDTIDSEIHRMLDDMLETMYDAPGIGLAGPQVGILQRLVVVDISEKEEPPQPLKLINPEVLWVSPETTTYEEGCLSLPEHYAEVTRPQRARIAYTDEHGARHEIDTDGLLSTCVQHEIDHLNGILFTDYLSSLKRNMIMRKLTKWKKTRAA